MKIVIRIEDLKNILNSIILIILFYVAVQVRMTLVNTTGYPSNFIDYNGHTINMLLSIKNPGFLISFALSEPAEWYKSSVGEYYWFEASPPITYLFGGLVSLFAKDVNTGWVTGSILYSLGVFIIYYVKQPIICFFYKFACFF